MKKKASIGDIFILIVIAFAGVIFLGLWYWSHNLVTNTLTSIDTGSSLVNISDAAQKTFGAINSRMYWLKTLSWVLIAGMVLTLLVSNFYIKAHPVIFPIYVFVSILAIVMSVYLSNAYENIILSNSLFGATFQSFTASTYILLHLPIFTAVVSIFGTILLLAGILRDEGAGGSVI